MIDINDYMCQLMQHTHMVVAWMEYSWSCNLGKFFLFILSGISAYISSILHRFKI